MLKVLKGVHLIGAPLCRLRAQARILSLRKSLVQALQRAQAQLEARQHAYEEMLLRHERMVARRGRQGARGPRAPSDGLAADHQESAEVSCVS